MPRNATTVPIDSSADIGRMGLRVIACPPYSSVQPITKQSQQMLAVAKSIGKRLANGTLVVD